MMDGAHPLVEACSLSKHFWISTARFQSKVCLRAVDGVSFHIDHEEVLGLVGESGCGKSTCGKVVLRIYEPSSGTIRFEGADITTLGGEALTAFRKRVMIVYQDPFGALDPRMTVGRTIGESLFLHRLPAKERQDRVHSIMERVGLKSSQANWYPHEFSGGQKQRVAIARALVGNPEFIVADEPLSALDVSIQAQILNLIQDLQREFRLSLLFISHDMSVVKHISDRVAVMYLGKIVESASRRELFRRPAHPYTQALLSAIPVPNPGRRMAAPVIGDVPNTLNPPPGCRFHPRCPRAQPLCREAEPVLTGGADSHVVACHFPG